MFVTAWLDFSRRGGRHLNLHVVGVVCCEEHFGFSFFTSKTIRSDKKERKRTAESSQNHKSSVLNTRMRPLRLAFLFAAAPATTQLTTTTKPAQSHTAVYTTTLPGPHNASQAVTTAVVTLLMPCEVPNIYGNGAPVTGTAVSHLAAPGASPWSTTAEVFWTVAGPMEAPATIPPPVPLAPGETVLTSVLTDITSYETTKYAFWSTAHSTILSTNLKTFLETVGGNTYPATIVRTGYTWVEVTATGGPVGGALGTVTATATYRKTTTMVQVKERPTMPAVPVFGPVGRL
jgi:hypothetical protein